MNPEEDIPQDLECGICMEAYKVPKTLPCIHTFCRICIARHIISQRVEHQRVRGFLCPLCRFYVRVPRPGVPLEQWADQLPNNTTIPPIIVAWKDRMSRFNTMCQYHQEETLTSFCKKCNCFACSKCLRERHPSCTGDAFCSVREIVDQRKTDMQSGLKEMDIEVKRMTDNVDLVKTVMSGLKDAEGTLVSDIKNHADLSIKSVTKLEADLLEQLDSAVDEQLRGMRMSKNPVDEAADILRHYKDEVDVLMRSSTGLTYMDNLELAKERHKECLDMIRRLKTQCRPPTITFVERETSFMPSIGTLNSSCSPVDPHQEDDVLASSPDEPVSPISPASSLSHQTYM